MKGFQLTQTELQALRLAHRTCKNKKDAYRINAVLLLGSGWSQEEVSEALLLDEDTLSSYVQKYRDGGISKLVETNYLGSACRLTEVQQTVLCKELDQTIYLTTKAICAYVQKQFSLEYSTRGLTNLLHRLGFSYKKPKIVPGNPNVEAQERFVEKFEILSENLAENERILFVDAVHAVHNVQAAYGWMRKGIDKEIPSNSGRQRLNIHGAMDAKSYEVTTISSEANIDGEATIDLFKHLLAVYPKVSKLYLILDNARYHYSVKVKAFLKSTTRIKLIFLPAYSPELNLIERLWKIFKKKVVYNRHYERFKVFKTACLDFFRYQGRYKDEIRSIMGDGIGALV